MSHLPVKFTVDESYAAGISGGPLNGSYTLNQLHLHWGSQSDQGSEHTVDGQRFEGNTHLQPATTALLLSVLSAMMENYTWCITSQLTTTSQLQSQIIK